MPRTLGKVESDWSGSFKPTSNKRSPGLSFGFDYIHVSLCQERKKKRTKERNPPPQTLPEHEWQKIPHVL